MARILVVGGTGSIGGYTALRLRERGDDVVLGARNPPHSSLLTSFELLRGDFAAGDFSSDRLAGFDAVIFAAANDIRQLPQGLDAAGIVAHYERTNSKAVPQFFRAAREAGISRAAYVGSFYPQAKPELVATDAYVRSRRDADEGARAEAGPDFHVVSLNAPIIVGGARGLMREKHRQLGLMALGARTDGDFAIRGGSNYMSVRSLYEAIIGGLEHGENGRGYLVGDENLTHLDYLKLYFAAAGRSVDLTIRDLNHPILGDATSPAVGRTISYEPEGADALGYTRGDIARTVAEIVGEVRESLSATVQ
jgi:nucleoside-diphosphate-sugar epimerase